MSAKYLHCLPKSRQLYSQPCIQCPTACPAMPLVHILWVMLGIQLSAWKRGWRKQILTLHWRSLSRSLSFLDTVFSDNTMNIVFSASHGAFAASALPIYKSFSFLQNQDPESSFSSAVSLTLWDISVLCHSELLRLHQREPNSEKTTQINLKQFPSHKISRNLWSSNYLKES